MTPELGILVGTRGRSGPLRGRLDQPALDESGVNEPGVAGVEVFAASLPGPLWLGGGEPTLRADLPVLVGALRGRPNLGLCTDGLAFANAQGAAQARSWGLKRVRIPLHSARMEAHDWLVELPGAGKRVVRALRACAEAGLEVQVELTLTRPTMDHLPETVALAAALGATSIRVRRLRGRGAAADRQVMLAARLGLAEPLLERAARAAWTAGVELSFDGFPACALGAAAEHLRLPTRWLAPTVALEPLAALLADPPAAPGCDACSGRPACPGAPADYVARFGRTEIDDRCSRPVGAAPLPEEPSERTPPPPPRAGRAPATRLAFAVAQAGRGSLRGDPMATVPPREVPAVVRVEFPPAEATRSIRQRLCRLAQEGSAELLLDDAASLDHPAIGELLVESVRLGFSRVEVRGPAGWVQRLSDRELIGLQGLSRVVLRVGQEPPPEESVSRLQRLTRAQVEIEVEVEAGIGSAPSDKG